MMVRGYGVFINRIEMDIPGNTGKVSFFFNKKAFIPSLIVIPGTFISTIKIRCITEVYM